MSTTQEKCNKQKKALFELGVILELVVNGKLQKTESDPH